MKLKVWEVYETTTGRSMCLGTKEDAEEQQAFEYVDNILEAEVDFTPDEIQMLIMREAVFN